MPAVVLEVVPLPGEDAPSEACEFCGRVEPLRWVVAIRGGSGEEDLLGALALCGAHAVPAAGLVARAFALVRGEPVSLYA